MPLDAREQGVEVHRLCDEVVVPGHRVGVRGGVLGVSRDHHDGRRQRPLPPQNRRQHPARHARHGHVEQRQIRRRRVEGRQRGLGVLGQRQRETEGAQRLLQQGAVLGVVVDDQDAPPRPAIAVEASARRGLAAAVQSRQHQAHLEARAGAGRALHRQLAALDLGEEPRDGQAEPGAAHGGGGIDDALEGAEDALHVGRRDAAPGVLHPDRRDVGAVAHREAHAAPVGVAHGVGKQVHQDLAQPPLVGVNQLRRLARHLEAEGEALLFRLHGEDRGHLVQHLAQARLAAVELQPPGLDLGDVEQPLDEVGEMLGRPADDAQRRQPPLGDAGIVLQKLRIAHDRVERRTQFVADADDVAALGLVRGLGGGLGALKLRVGALMGAYLGHEARGLAFALAGGEHAAFVGERVQPRRDADDDEQEAEGEQQRAVDACGGGGLGETGLLTDQQQDRRDDEGEATGDADEQAVARPRHAGQRVGQCAVGEARALRVDGGAGAADVSAARLQRAAQRADLAGVERARDHVLGVEPVLAYGAGPARPVRHGREAARRRRQPGRLRPREIEAAAGGQGDRRRGAERDAERQEARERLHRRAERAELGGQRQGGGQRHGPDADRIDVVEIAAPELDAPGAQAEGPVHHEVGGQRPDPGHRDVAVERQRVLQRAEHAELHQHQRDGDVEHKPHHAARMRMGQPREEVRPCDRAGVGVRDVDLELGEDDEDAGQQHRGLGARKALEGGEIHLGRLDRLRRGHPRLQDHHRQIRARQHLERADDGPARPGGDERRPPFHPVGAGLRLRQEAQEVHLLADLGEQREHHARGHRDEHRVDPAARLARRRAVSPLMRQPWSEVRPLADQHHEGQDLQRQPHRLGPFLEHADAREAVRHQRDDDERVEQVAKSQRHAEAQLQRLAEDRGLQREEDEGEAGVDQRGRGRAEIAEPCAARQQVDVDARARRVPADRQPGEKHQRADDEDRRDRVVEAVGQRHRRADRLQREKRDRADGGVGDPAVGPFPRPARGEAQREVLQRLVRNPLVVGAPEAAHAADAVHHGAAPPRIASRRSATVNAQ